MTFLQNAKLNKSGYINQNYVVKHHFQSSHKRYKLQKTAVLLRNSGSLRIFEMKIQKYMFEDRKYIIQGLFILTGVIFLIRLFYLQVLDDSYKQAASANAVQRIIDYPYRGSLYDRNNKLLVYNIPVFDILVVPKELDKNLDTLAVCRLFRMSKEDFIAKMKEAKSYSRFKPSPFVKQLGQEDFAAIQDRLAQFKGFIVSPRTVRGYPHQSMANVLGYIGEISKNMLERMKQQGNTYYSSGDYIGISGLEAEYEELLRGKRGVRHVLVNVHGLQKGKFEEGKFDTLAIRGEDLYTTLDLDLQQYGEQLMQNKAGSIVAIEPSTGEILAFVSAPTYDPNLLTIQRNFSTNFNLLQQDPNKPLFNRPLMAMYPPGSVFKLIQALIGQQLGVIDSNSTFPCDRSIVNCHSHPSPTNLHGAIRYSCNPYFVSVFRRIINRNQAKSVFKEAELGYKEWREMAHSFGIGVKLGTDIPHVKTGILPTTNYFDKVYGAGRWKFSNLYSMSIGQGEVGTIPLQLANLACIMANRGWYITPHFIRSAGQKGKPEKFKQKHKTVVDEQFYTVAVNGMEDAVRSGTVTWRAHLKGVSVCGKTGTAQNPHGDDHSVFICFAPKYNPKIALAVFVENAGFGGLVAAPIASLMIEKYLNDTITRKDLEKQMLEKQFLLQKPM
jgi:penicillin-binding protein 2